MHAFSEVAVSRDPGARDRYYKRKAAGLCTRCGQPAADGAQLCPTHLLDQVERRRRLRAARRDRRCCIDCNAPSETYRCPRCHTGDNTGDQHQPALLSSQRSRRIEWRWVTEGDGRRRRRYGGRGRRGAPTSREVDAWDCRTLETELGLMSRDYGAYYSDENMALPRIQRDAALRSALGHLELFVRTALDLADRWRKRLK